MAEIKQGAETNQQMGAEQEIEVALREGVGLTCGTPAKKVSLH